VLPDSGDLGAQLVDLGRHRADRGGNFGFGEARGDVLRTIPFPADDIDEEGAFGGGAVAVGHQRGDRGGIVGELDDRRMADELQPVAVRIVHQEERDAVVVGQIGGADILAVAAIVGEADAVARDVAQEARRAAAMLHIGPAVGGDARHVKAVAQRDMV